MIDWITAKLPCRHDPSKLISGMVMSFDSKGDNEWVVNKKLSVEGSYSSKIQVASADSGHIWISGNPVKFLQGHNIFGSNDLKQIMVKFFDALLLQEALGLNPTETQYEYIKDGLYDLSRVDMNESWHLNNKNDVMAWIRAFGNTVRLKHRGAGQFSGDTAYIGKNSRRWGVKCYSKGHEISAKGHQLPKELQIPELLEYADKSLRLELVMRQLELKRRGLDMAYFWTENTAKMLLQTMVLDNLELSSTFMIDDKILDTLPTRLRLVYQSWKNGDDLKQIMTKPTFYRVRKQLQTYGIDIATVNEKNNIVPLIRYLEAEPVGIPDWAYEKGLVA
ncbi:phage/plasmid replication protein, II/X family [Acinetobacter modestus]|uniref:phage/plasmid replication protein, II/X family n=1 Tax=Acinetobacter modestus TaxID=1776740 RepID=UPI00301A412F